MLQRVSLQMFNKYSKNILPKVISALFITNDTFHSHNTRNKNKLQPKMSNREYMYKNFSFIGVYILNDIQDHISLIKVWVGCECLLKSNNDQVKPENTVKLRIRKNKNIPAKY